MRVGIERHTKLVLAFELGRRTITSASRFMTKRAAATNSAQRFQLATDGLATYNYAVGLCRVIASIIQNLRAERTGSAAPI